MGFWQGWITLAQQAALIRAANRQMTARTQQGLGNYYASITWEIYIQIKLISCFNKRKLGTGFIEIPAFGFHAF